MGNIECGCCDDRQNPNQTVTFVPASQAANAKLKDIAKLTAATQHSFDSTSARRVAQASQSARPAQQQQQRSEVGTADRSPSVKSTVIGPAGVTENVAAMDYSQLKQHVLGLGHHPADVAICVGQAHLLRMLTNVQVGERVRHSTKGAGTVAIIDHTVNPSRPITVYYDNQTKASYSEKSVRKLTRTASPLPSTAAADPAEDSDQESR